MIALFLNDMKVIHKCVCGLVSLLNKSEGLLSFVRDVIYLFGLKNKLRDAFDLFVLILNNRF